MDRDPIDPHGPVFVSYRQSDGSDRAAELAWMLRAAGIPVWHDVDDLPPGDTDERLGQALASGLSGAVLVVTPDIEHSVVVRTIELPTLLRLEKQPMFVLAVGNTVRGISGGVDYDAPDRLLGQPAGTLSRLKQHAADTRDGLAKIARDVLWHRLSQLTASQPAPTTLHLSMQTRATPHAIGNDSANLSMRLRPPAVGRLPSREGLEDLRSALPLLPAAVSIMRPAAVRMTGRAHLTVALALGAALPATLVGEVSVEGTDGEEWRAGTVSTPPGESPLSRVEGHGTNASGANAVLAYVDLLPDLSNAAYARLLDDNPDQFAAWVHLRAATDVPLDPDAAGPLITEVAGRLRKISQDHGNAHLHLALRAPFPVAVLLGRLLNTVRITAYEWEHAAAGDADTRPRYVPSVEISATDADGPITAVLAP